MVSSEISKVIGQPVILADADDKANDDLKVNDAPRAEGDTDADRTENSNADDAENAEHAQRQHL